MFINPEIKRECVDLIKSLANLRIPNYEQPADSFIEDCVDKIAEKIKSSKEVDREERIICAANYYDDGRSDHGYVPHNIKIGFIVCGHRHHNCIHTFAQIVGFPYNKKGLKIMRTEIQGFLTSTNRFLNRKEALEVARAANQIITGEGNSKLGLFSEDLY